MSQQFCPRLSEAICSKIVSLDQLFHTPSNCKFQNFAAEAFHWHLSYLWREIAENLDYSSENWGFLYAKSPHMIFIEPNMDEGCRIFHRFSRNPSQNFLRLTNSIVICKIFVTKNSNYLTIKQGVSWSSMWCHHFHNYPCITPWKDTE